ncbi:hypothetical protein AWC15_22305 [Mycobacterium lacus]|uniref:Uncharacterized protein n=1 Tax=Mycobacterium lacus TaxID=169765 RepID=A0A1X1Y529_9MYCO|nr:hypothetical protein AWC15_22305 [Mycobacterium lacus]BBX98093.1 hypothetical protein MLAC_33870 [Mycobacterium lacus]
MQVDRQLDDGALKAAFQFFISAVRPIPVVVEAYRHLIDPIADTPVPPISPRALIACDVSVSVILDLRSAANRVLANLTMEQLQSDTRDRDAYSACQNVAPVAH